MKVNKAIGFVCPTCNQAMKIHAAGLGDDQCVYLIGLCEFCEEPRGVDVDGLMVSIYGGSHAKQEN